MRYSIGPGIAPHFWSSAPDPLKVFSVLTVYSVGPGVPPHWNPKAFS